MRSIQRIWFILTLLAAPTLGSAAENVSGFRLNNGMQVVVIEDHRAPIAVQMVWYFAGAADEQPGKSGIAHYVEHLMFKGTEKFGPGAFSNAIKLIGGSDNAFTTHDYTAYVQRVAVQHLETVMEMEADRMRGLVLSSEDIETERQVVLEERIERTDSNPSAVFGEQRSAAQYLNHPYGIPVIGWRHEIERLDRDDIFDFYSQHYVPNNALLLVAGDVNPDAVLEMAERHYGVIEPSTRIPERPRPKEPPQLSERRLTYADPRVSTPYVVRTYLVPERDSGDQETAAALSLLAEIIGGAGINSVLSQKLEVKDELAVHTAAYYGGTSLDDTRFTLVVVPKEGVALGEAEAALDEALAEFVETGVDSDHLDRVKTQVRASWIYAQDDVQSLAYDYGSSLVTGLTLEDIAEWPEVLQEVTEEAIIKAANGLLDRRKSVTGWLMREEGSS